MTSAPPPAPPTADPPAWEPPPPPPPGLPPRSQLRRSSTDKMLGGVSGGLARYSGIDPLLWRGGFFALGPPRGARAPLSGGPGVLVSRLLWLLMPADAAPPGERRTPLAGVADRRAAAGSRSPVPGPTISGLLIALRVLVLFPRLTAWGV